MAKEPLNPLKNCFTDWFQHIIDENQSIKPIPEEKVQEIYALAYALYQNQQYQESDRFFRLLIFLRPTKPNFWKCLGACLQMQKAYEESLNCYMYCLHFNNLLNQKDPYLYVQIADCHFALKQTEEGLKALELARLNANKKHDARISQHVTLMQQLWSKPS